MATPFILIPGRTSRQGTSLNGGSYTDDDRDETNTVQICAEDLQRLGLQPGDQIRMWNDVGEVIIPCKESKGDELPAGMLFISYGDSSSRLMGGETHGSGMPDSKGLDVFLEKYTGVN